VTAFVVVTVLGAARLVPFAKLVVECVLVYLGVVGGTVVNAAASEAIVSVASQTASIFGVLFEDHRR